MARIGINPARGQVSGYHPARVTVALVTYVPDLSGYFERRLEVLKLALASLESHTTVPHDLMIFDNASCPEVVAYLRQKQEQGLVKFLILSERNIGKIDALRVLFNAAPGEIIAYSDDDIFFYPGWLEAHLEVLDCFPPAGMVSGVAVRNAAGHAHNSLDRLVEQGAPGLSVAHEQRIPDAWEADWAASTGRDPQAHLQNTQEHLDLVLRMEKVGGSVCEVIGSANHFQFITPKQVILEALPSQWTGRLMGSMIELDEAVDNLGCLRLSTVGRYARHLGNALSAEVIAEARDLGLAVDAIAAPAAGKRRPKHWLLRLPGSRRVLSGLYQRLFKILFR